jgi:predicted flap endonuclease-1-like 5' DNA nuclease
MRSSDAQPLRDVKIHPMTEVGTVSKARDDRATRVNDVRRGTREYLLRIRQERIARSEQAVEPSVEPPPRYEPGPSAGLLPDPLISRLSQQLRADESTAVSRTTDLTSGETPPAAGQAPRDQGRAPRPAGGAARIQRQNDTAELGMSPLPGQGNKLKLDLSFARPPGPQSRQQENFANFMGLEPLMPVARKEASAKSEPVRTPPAAPRGVAAPPLPGIETVPTLGPGIVWRLAQAGVHSMAELAASDAAAIRMKLGQIGRLVKVEDWIAYARAVVAGQTPDAPPSRSNPVASPQTATRAVCVGRLGQAGIGAVTDGRGFGARDCPVAGAVVARDSWFVAVLEGAPQPVTMQLGHLITNPQISEVTLRAFDAVESRRLVASGVQVSDAASASGGDGFDPRRQSAADLTELVLGAF